MAENKRIVVFRSAHFRQNRRALETLLQTQTVTMIAWWFIALCGIGNGALVALLQRITTLLQSPDTNAFRGTWRQQSF